MRENTEVDGNAEQTHRVAEQLFREWEEKQRRRALLSSVPAWFACLLSACALVWSAAITTQKVSEHSKRIDRLEADGREQARDTRTIAVTMGRIEGKIDLLLPALAERK